MPRRANIILLLFFATCFTVILVSTVFPTVYISALEGIWERPHSSDVLEHDIIPAHPASGPLITDLRQPVDALSKNWVSHNEIAMQTLFGCLEASSCPENRTKVILLGWDAFIHEIEQVAEGGEVIWARSTVRALKKLGYTYLYTPNNERTLQLYHVFRGLITAIFVEQKITNACLDNPQCILSSSNPSGIPLWKFFNFYWWTGSVGPPRNKWTLSPEDYQLEGRGYIGNNYLGYSIEPACSLRSFVPHSERKRQAYVLAKEMWFFEPGRRPWQPDFYDAAHNTSNVEFVSGVRGNATPDFPPQIKNLGYMSQSDFYDQLSRSLVLVGVGLPWTSPTPYDALCLGVPFINPVVAWDTGDPLNRNKWEAQHGMLKHLNPPYVYHVYKNDRDGFVNAIKEAVSHPIESFVLDRMRMEAVEERLGNILSVDWETEFKAISLSLESP
ncbi:hypothetical protein K438DRAFT_1835497 [Mycena galopus ATCC 62051]|nr:hypothetical protein K438DRAFT_1835497 [Mycena galopus ATCC 62051]